MEILRDSAAYTGRRRSATRAPRPCSIYWPAADARLSISGGVDRQSREPGRQISICPLTEDSMSGVRVLVGTRKGAFILTSDGKRNRWDIAGPHFGGWELY